MRGRFAECAMLTFASNIVTDNVHRKAVISTSLIASSKLYSIIDNLNRESLRVSTNATTQTVPVAGRKAMMTVLAQARASEIAAGLAALAEPLDHVELRPAEIGLVMVRGRIGGDGQPFNVGEATVTRAAVRLASGEVGFSYLLGRDRERARLAAICDALWQNEAKRAAVEHHVLAPIRARAEAELARQRAQTAATRVDFFTLVRGEDG
jgi:alpha-D-ribose 1-methylphosphonate 5-triphosphate synthase subunit PhnG